ncbi:MAG: DUF1996 domain-containing protein [Actinomycetota bacterium]
MRHLERPEQTPHGARSWLAAAIFGLAASLLPSTIAGAAAGVGSFRVACGPVSHFGTFDPIVFPGQEPAGHQHEFYGSTSTGPSSTPSSLLGSATLCSDSADSSGYWHPTVFFDGVRAPAPKASIYYTQRTTKKPLGDIQVWPVGLRVIAGDAHAATPQDLTKVWWDCDGATMDHQASAPTCPTGSRGLEANVRFPDCWDGVNLDSSDHKSHLSYSVNIDGTYRCDAAHPVSLPFIHMIFRWDGQYPNGGSVSLSNGSSLAFHADFMNGWQQDRLVALVDGCIRASIECGMISGGTKPSAVAPTTATTVRVPAQTGTTLHAAPAAADPISDSATAEVIGPVPDNPVPDNPVPNNPVPDNPVPGNPVSGNPVSGNSPTISGPPLAAGRGLPWPISPLAGIAVVLGAVVLGSGIWGLGSLAYDLLRRGRDTPVD